MHRTRILIVLLLGLLAAGTVAPTAQAQDLYRNTSSIDGEPTDLEGVLAVVGQATLDDNDVDTTPPAEQAEFDSWFDQLLQLLRDLGLLPTGND
jgi:hypothetical protein